MPYAFITGLQGLGYRRSITMRIGLVGDSHDHLHNIIRTVAFLNAERVDLVLHTGDFIAPFVIPEFARCTAPVVGVFGNNDGDRESLNARCGEYRNMEIRGNFCELEPDGLKVALLHGQEGALLHDLVESGFYDLVVHGHTHRAEISRRGKTMVINPGEICGYLTGNPTCALFDTITRDARIVPMGVPRNPGD
jgi:putative phosphoesterase